MSQQKQSEVNKPSNSGETVDTFRLALAVLESAVQSAWAAEYHRAVAKARVQSLESNSTGKEVAEARLMLEAAQGLYMASQQRLVSAREEILLAWEEKHHHS